jgi:hypothetical protein
MPTEMEIGTEPASLKNLLNEKMYEMLPTPDSSLKQIESI